MDPLIWSVLCCFLMVLMVILELFTPSFGLFTVLALSALGASVWFGFQSSDPAGYVMVAANIVLLPVAVLIGMKLIKHSPLMLHDSIQANFPAVPAPPAIVHAMVGQQGTAVTVLRPAGTAQFGDKRIDVVTDGKFVEEGQPVKVLKVEGNIVVVEPV